VLVASFIAPTSHVLWVDLTTWHVTLVAADDDLHAAVINTEATHFLFPVDERSKAVFVVDIVYHDYTIRVLVELLSDQAVVIIT